MKKRTVLLLVVLFIVCLGTVIVDYINQPQDPNFVSNEKLAWENQDHFYCAKLFGFAWGWGEWHGIFRNEIFDWTASSNWEGFIVIRINKSLPKKIVKKFFTPNKDFDFFASDNAVMIKTRNNNWVETHCQAKKALREELRTICEKIGLEMVTIRHDSFR